MKYTPTMQRVITAIAAKHGLDLRVAGSHLRLELGQSMMPLVIEVVLPGMISVAHYYRQNGDTIADPDVEIFTLADGWAPAAITQVLSGYVNYVEDERGQHDLADFCELWAQNLEDQGYLARGQRPDEGAAVAVLAAV